MITLIIIIPKYFKWSESSSGYCLSILSCFSIPLYFTSCRVSQQLGERFVLKKGFLTMICGLWIGINYQALFILLRDSINYIESEVDYNGTGMYDGMIGSYQYFIATSTLFFSSVLIEGASLSLIAKSHPDKLHSAKNINTTTLVPIFSIIGQLLGGLIIVIVGFSHHHIYTDIVNSISFFLLIASYCCYYQVKKHFFFMYGDNS